ncbi:MAG: hypothetical protein EPN33_11420 [Acidobacteria bacterium]|nr:MAG: hypothetical protein EPN33_11420 [Acidobacteriota bacterium]
MAVQITIRNVPDAVRNELASRAAAEGRSMQEYLRLALERLASQPTNESLMRQIRERKRLSQSRISAEQILRYRDEDRR